VSIESILNIGGHMLSPESAAQDAGLTDVERKNFIDAVVSTSSVVRYHGHHVLKQQSVADHSARVAMLAFAVGLEYFKDPDRASLLSSYALFHDITEGILRSDINSAVKSRYNIRALVKQIEHDVVEEAFTSGSYSSGVMKVLFLEQCSPEYYNLLKVCDTLDFGLYVSSEIKSGNKHLLHLLEAFKTEYASYPETVTSLNICMDVYNKILQDL
jgi:5'-deoxynucleotidase YfbR-like HD superfamily hydrolase